MVRALVLVTALFGFCMSSAGQERDDGPSINLLPLFENRVLPSGGRRTSVLLLLHRTRDRHGNLSSFHFLNHFVGPNYTLLLPLMYSIGEPGRRHMGLIPLYFRGPGYRVLFPLLWQRFRGEDTTTVIPLLWYGRRPEPGVPLTFNVLGGLVARDCNYENQTYRYRLLWFIRIGRVRRFEAR